MGRDRADSLPRRRRVPVSLSDSAPARAAVADFATFLRTSLHPEGSFPLGRDRFEHLLRNKHGLDLAPDDLYRHGADLSADLLDRLNSFGAWRQEVERLKRDHPTRETLLQTYADEAARARSFVERSNLVPIPAGEQFEVRPTAPFLRATMPLGHFDRTPPFADDDNLGILYITPVDAELPAARQAELLEAPCFTAIRAICLHETFPGHHVQLWHSRLRSSPIRKQFHSSLFSEGWALYCEEQKEAAGYYASPGLRLWRLKNAMWRAARLMVDVGLHCRGQTLEEADVRGSTSVGSSPTLPAAKSCAIPPRRRNRVAMCWAAIASLSFVDVPKFARTSRRSSSTSDYSRTAARHRHSFQTTSSSLAGC
jgi:uncharacterized protein (DUF885 family)